MVIQTNWTRNSDREYDFNEIATITRASAAKIYGYQDRGELTPGYNADIAVYDLNPNDIDPSKEPAAIEHAFGNAMYTIKDGQILVKDGEVVKWFQVIHYGLM